MGQVFISYSRTDADYVAALTDYLRDAGIAAFYDKDISYGDQWWGAIVKRIRACSAMVVVMTPALEASDWVVKEILLARREEKPIFPLLRAGTGYPLLIDIEHLDVTSGQMPGEDFVTALQRAGGIGPPEASGPGPVAGQHAVAGDSHDRSAVAPPEQAPVPIGTRQQVASGLDLDALAARVERAEETLQACRRASESGRQDRSLLLTQARALSDLQRSRECIAVCNALLGDRTDDVEARVLRGISLIDLGRRADGLRDLDTALSSDPDNVEALTYKAMTIEDDNEGLAIVERALALDPDNPEGLAAKSILLLNKDQLELAGLLADQALRTDPSTMYGWYARVGVFIGTERYDRAREITRALSLIFPESAPVLTVEAMAQLFVVLNAKSPDDDMVSELEQLAQRARNADPDVGGSVRVYGHLATAAAVALGRRDKDQALAELAKAEEAADTKIDRAAVHAVRALILDKLGQPIGAMWSALKAWWVKQ
jgi:tetratricopeptide (TPR) repeat protein